MTDTVAPDLKAPLEQAKKNCGGNVGLARMLGDITSQAISQWREVPLRRVNDVARVSGIPREILRPDMFGVDLARACE